MAHPTKTPPKRRTLVSPQYLTLVLDERDRKVLEEVAQIDRTNLSETVRRAIREYSRIAKRRLRMLDEESALG